MPPSCLKHRGEIMEVAKMEIDKLDEFRHSVQDFLPEPYLQDDTFLNRWLIAREFNVDKARVVLQSYMEWKDSNEIDKILEWHPPEELVDACPFEVLGKDTEGRPVLLFPWGKWKPWVFTEQFVHIYQKYMDYMLHSVLARLKPPATQFVMLADSDGFSYGHMKYIKALELNLEAVRQFECHYPELLHSAIVINCPRAFTLLYSLIKPMMSKRTKDKINIFGCDKRKWREFLVEQHIPQDTLPRNYRIDAISCDAIPSD